MPSRLSTAVFCLIATIASSGCNTEKDADTGNSTAVSLELKSRISTGVFDDGAAEIVAYDAASQRLFVVNGADKAIDVYDIADIDNPTTVGSIDVTTADSAADAPNSVASHGGLIAVAIQNNDKQANGFVAIYNAADLTQQNVLTVGALPDMVTFTPAGTQLLVANEGEPNDAYDNDPEGSISIIDLSGGVAAATVTTADFNAFDDDLANLRAAGVRIFGPNASVSQDLEPEYIAINDSNQTATVSLQENNAVAIVNLLSGEVTDILPLGFKDHSAAGNELDASDRDDTINIQSWPVLGMYQPDSIAYYRTGGVSYIVTANEGDARDYDGFSEEVRVKDLDLDNNNFPAESVLLQDSDLGRLTVTSTLGDEGDDGDYEALYAFGARSFSIFRASDMSLVFDSGSDFEDITANSLPGQFNFSNDSNDADEIDSRSDAKGPEPEALTIANLDGRDYVFIGLERIGGIMVYDISEPGAPQFITYQIDRDFSQPANTPEAGDLGPEGIIVIDADDSPTDNALLVVANEVSGTTTIYEINIR